MQVQTDQIAYSASSDMDGHVCLGISVLIHVLQVNTRYLFFYKLIASDTHWKYLKSGNSNQYPKCFHLERQKKKKKKKKTACIKGSWGVRDSQTLPWDFQKSMPGSLGLPTFKGI